jgi:superfamily II DNA or RNA helicase
MIDVIVSNRLVFKYKKLPVKLFEAIKENFKYKNPQYYKDMSMGFKYTKEPQYMKSYFIDKDNISIARGAKEKLEELVNEYNKISEIEVDLNYIDKTISIPYKFESIINLRDYQIEPCDKLVKTETALMQGVCGCGKTIILLKAIEKIGQKTLIIVHEQKLQQQWFDEVHKLFGIPKEEIGLIGGIAKKPSVKPITIAMQQSLLKNPEKYSNEFGCIVCDEVHRYAANTFQKVVDAFPAKYRIGGTATPKRKDGKQVLMFDQFGRIVHEITDKQLLELDMTHNVKIIVVYTDFVYRGDMRTVTNKVFIGNDEDGIAQFDKQESEHMVHNEFLDNIIKNANRNKLIFRFLEAEVKNKNYCLLLADRRAFCLNWQKWLSYKNIEAKLLIGGSKEEGDEAIRRIAEGNLHVVIGTTIADEGLNLPKLSRGFSATPSATNERRITQQVGRIKRKCEGKKDAIWYYFLDYKIEGFENHLKLLKRYFKNLEVLSNKYEIDEYLNSIDKGV